MGKIECFALAGLELFFPSNDHDPPHFHVLRRGEWMIKVFINECTEDELVYEAKWPTSYVPPKNVRKNILQMVLEHRIELLQEHAAKVCKNK